MSVDRDRCFFLRKIIRYQTKAKQRYQTKAKQCRSVFFSHQQQQLNTLTPEVSLNFRAGFSPWFSTAFWNTSKTVFAGLAAAPAVPIFTGRSASRSVAQTLCNDNSTTRCSNGTQNSNMRRGGHYGAVLTFCVCMHTANARASCVICHRAKVDDLLSTCPLARYKYQPVRSRRCFFLCTPDYFFS